MKARARGRRKEGAGDMRGKDIKLEKVKASLTQGGAGEGGVRVEENVEEARGSAACAASVTNIRTTKLAEIIHGAGAPFLGRSD